MKERPIIFSGESVRAIIDGRKTQTRRIIRKQPKNDGRPIRVVWPNGKRWDEITSENVESLWRIGDRLWVREAIDFSMCGHIEYARPKASQDVVCIYDTLKEINVFFGRGDVMDHDGVALKWSSISPIHMPRWASRITLEVVGVRVERLQEISEADAKAEGYPPDLEDDGFCAVGTVARARGMKIVNEAESFACRISDGGGVAPKEWYQCIWEEINGPGSWQANPWVWAIEFKRVEKGGAA